MQLISYFTQVRAEKNNNYWTYAVVGEWGVLALIMSIPKSKNLFQLLEQSVQQFNRVVKRQ
jgi:hypothetical protein